MAIFSCCRDIVRTASSSERAPYLAGQKRRRARTADCLESKVAASSQPQPDDPGCALKFCTGYCAVNESTSSSFKPSRTSTVGTNFGTNFDCKVALSLVAFSLSCNHGVIIYIVAVNDFDEVILGDSVITGAAVIAVFDNIGLIFSLITNFIIRLPILFGCSAAIGCRIILAGVVN